MELARQERIRKALVQYAYGKYYGPGGRYKRSKHIITKHPPSYDPTPFPMRPLPIAIEDIPSVQQVLRTPKPKPPKPDSAEYRIQSSDEIISDVIRAVRPPKDNY